MSPVLVTGQQLLFAFDDPDRRYVSVALDCDEAVAGRRRFRRTTTGWSLRIPRPPLNRLEYQLVTTERGGSISVGRDPANGEAVSTAFGERSVVLMPGYREPAWLQQGDSGGGSVAHVTHHDAVIGALPIRVWSPQSMHARDPAPLLVVNDGPEYVERADLARYAIGVTASGDLPPFRMALMHPSDRDAWYAANPAYASATADAVAALSADVHVTGSPVIMGASLGGLSALLTALAARPTFAGVVSQSGSFFSRDLDEQESTYPYFDRVVAAVDTIGIGHRSPQPLQIGMTCGALEENLANNERMAEVLTRLGHQVSFRPVADLHNYTGWRDSLDPTLTEVLRAVWGARG